MIELGLTIIATSLIGSTHCVGMCGPFATMAFAVGGKPTRSRWAMTAYHVGRLITYTAMGCMVGGLGAGVDSSANLVGLQRGAVWMSAFVLGLMVAARALQLGGIRLPLACTPRPWLAVVEAAHRAAWTLGPVPRAGAIGLVTTLLPCGWLYAFAAIAGGTGSVLGGAGVMGCFWLGTVPALSALGLGARRGLAKLGPRASLAATAAMFGLCVASLTTRGGFAGMVLPEVTPGGVNASLRLPMVPKPVCHGAQEVR